MIRIIMTMLPIHHQIHFLFFFSGIDAVVVDVVKLSDVIVCSDLVNGFSSGFNGIVDEIRSLSSNSRSQLSPETTAII